MEVGISSRRVSASISQCCRHAGLDPASNFIRQQRPGKLDPGSTPGVTQAGGRGDACRGPG